MGMNSTDRPRTYTPSPAYCRLADVWFAAHLFASMLRPMNPTRIPPQTSGEPNIAVVTDIGTVR